MKGIIDKSKYNILMIIKLKVQCYYKSELKFGTDVECHAHEDESIY